MSNSSRRQRETIRAIKNRARRGRRYTALGRPGYQRDIRTGTGVPKSSQDRYWQNMHVGAADRGERKAYSAYFQAQKGGPGQTSRVIQRRAQGLWTRPRQTGWKPHTKYWG